jgi:hypothetical protein
VLLEVVVEARGGALLPLLHWRLQSCSCHGSFTSNQVLAGARSSHEQGYGEDNSHLQLSSTVLRFH